MPEPPSPPPPGPIDCSTTPDDPSCKAAVPGPLDCNTNPNDPSCGPQPPVDCKTTPNDPACTTPPIDCTKKPDHPSCKQPPCDPATDTNCPSTLVDCTKNPDDPSCKVDCTTNPSDPSCPPTPPCQPAAAIGISCPPPPPSCPSGEHYDPDQKKCVPDIPKCPAVQGVSGGSSNDCPPCPRPENGPTVLCPPHTCPPGQHFDPKVNKCVPDKPICPKGQHYDTNLKRCIPDCPKDQHFNPILNKCVPDCPPGFHLENKVCTKTIIKRVNTVETVFRNIFPNPNQPSFLLLLDTAQLCQIAGDTQCVAKQNQFDTLNLVTKLDSTGKTWTITGQVENRAVSKTQNNVQVIAYFYDSKGNNVGGPYKGTVNPTVLKSLQLGAFTMKPSMSIMKGTPTFIRLEYQSITS